MKIDKTEVYSVRQYPSDKPRYYRTLPGAMSRIAWWLIFSKYYTEYDGIVNQDIIEHLPPHYACECGKHGSPHEEPEHTLCPIHDRETGYFKRLHDRLTSFLVSKYSSEAYPVRL